MNKHILHTGRVESTNDFLKSCIRDGVAKAPFCVSADEQTAGKGQRDKQWESSNGLNVLASFLVQQPMGLSELPKLNFAAVIAVAQSLSAFGLREIQIKWPNDVYIEGRKIAGVLVENALDSSGLKYSIIGIGLNVNQTSYSESRIGSMKMFTGKSFNRIEVLECLYENLYAHLRVEHASLLSSVNEALYKKGEQVVFKVRGERVPAFVLAVTPEGTLKVQTEEEIVELQHHYTEWDHESLH